MAKDLDEQDLGLNVLTRCGMTLVPDTCTEVHTHPIQRSAPDPRNHASAVTHQAAGFDDPRRTGTATIREAVPIGGALKRAPAPFRARPRASRPDDEPECVEWRARAGVRMRPFASRRERPRRKDRKFSDTTRAGIETCRFARDHFDFMQVRTDSPTPVEAAPRRRRRLPLVAAAVGVAAAAAVGGSLLVERPSPSAGAEQMELTLPGEGGVTLGSCLPFTVEYLADMSPAFAGTVIEATGERAVLRVDRWYAGGDASEVVVTVPDGAHIALKGTIDFEEGKRYLITAEGGTVNLCGYSGEATAELESAFETAF